MTSPFGMALAVGLPLSPSLGCSYSFRPELCRVFYHESILNFVKCFLSVYLNFPPYVFAFDSVNTSAILH